MGFDFFALITHVDLRRPRHNVIHLDNYPVSWAQHFVEEGLYTHDPILHACLTTNVGFDWADVPRMIDVTGRQRSILENAARHGIGDGFTVPANIPGESSGSCSFAMRPGHRPPVRNFLLAQLIGAFAFQAARRLNGLGSMSQKRPRHLTPRQRDCLIWAIRGKTDWEIGRILGLSEETVSQHLDMARGRYGVTRRLPLAAHAIFDGQISFVEALSWQFPPKRE
ncbi:LuxR family transcriptional regulator [Acidiphilium sp. AL]|uniref:LuxR family transcriptional regulator n=1 Tax=Acidiphilium sp. AL TaxID=2871704 RepID=UPI0021CB6B43|nr:LuxR family transcriptional regulator [Acidiphilium sp. AL]